MTKIIIPNGTVFGMLTVKKEVERFIQPSGQGQRGFLCICACGNEKKVRLSHLRQGRVKSCWCKIGESHKMAYSHLYRIWRSMKWRCDSRNPKPEKYYKRGITVDLKWANSFIAFKNWSIDHGYMRSLTIDRENNDLGYSPENCRWVTTRVNNCNRRNTVYVEYGGERVSACLLIESLGRLDDMSTLMSRIRKGMSIQKALSTPIRLGRYQ